MFFFHLYYKFLSILEAMNIQPIYFSSFIYIQKKENHNFVYPKAPRFLEISTQNFARWKGMIKIKPDKPGIFKKGTRSTFIEGFSIWYFCTKFDAFYLEMKALVRLVNAAFFIT